MKPVLITIMVCYVFIFWIGIPIRNVVFSGDEVEKSHLDPLYAAIILLSGLIAGGTLYIVKTKKNTKSSHEKKENTK